ncbi:MAG TPA: sterol desaturase family protein [Aliidongia sp.]|uniref:sterol desaturase family protein n=1 Tax=Aliidongia sp. TaxID=1914230 RepID=UPI002DDCABE3|nr:sterol desaturase family protein [Aliidongia sp.]HEV2677974.1 sterol desaturase family protein [Aliidongia sp.]
MLDAAFALIGTTAAVYALLLITYFTTGWLFFSNDPARADKIQPGRALAAEKVRRDIRQSVRSLASIALMFSIGHVLYARYHIGFAAWPTSVWSVVASFVLSMLAYDTWFYWMHRLLHSRRLYRRIHRWHHLSLPSVAWSNNSDTLLDNLFLQSYWLAAHLIVPVAPLVLLVHKLYDHVSGIIGHSGVEHGGGICWPPSPMNSVTHHDQHHRFFNCNYAPHFTLWDRLMGTLHPSHDAELKDNLRRRRAPVSAPTGSAGSPQP